MTPQKTLLDGGHGVVSICSCSNERPFPWTQTPHYFIISFYSLYCLSSTEMSYGDNIIEYLIIPTTDMCTEFSRWVKSSGVKWGIANYFLTLTRRRAATAGDEMTKLLTNRFPVWFMSRKLHRRQNKFPLAIFCDKTHRLLFTFFLA